MKVKVLIGDFEIDLTESIISDIVYSLPSDEYYKDLYSYIIRNTKDANLISSVINTDQVSQEDIEFLLENRSSDLFLWQDIIRADKVAEIIEEEAIISLMEKSDTIAEDVANYIEGYQRCDPVTLSDWIVNNASLKVIVCLANNYGAPKNILRKLSKHESLVVSLTAKNTLD